MSGPKNASSRLRHRLTLQQEIDTPDDGGGASRGWEDVAMLWAEIMPFSRLGKGGGQEVFVTGQLESQVSHRITLRYRSGITAAMRLVFDSRIFNIRTVINVDERNEMLALLAQENVAN